MSKQSWCNEADGLSLIKESQTLRHCHTITESYNHYHRYHSGSAYHRTASIARACDSPRQTEKLLLEITIQEPTSNFEAEWEDNKIDTLGQTRSRIFSRTSDTSATGASNNSKNHISLHFPRVHSWEPTGDCPLRTAYAEHRGSLSQIPLLIQSVAAQIH